MIIRIQSPDGMSRVNIDNASMYTDLFLKIKDVRAHRAVQFHFSHFLIFRFYPLIALGHCIKIATESRKLNQVDRV